MENISIKFENNRELLNDINIFIPSGSLISIKGKPGSGKTKFFNVLGLKEKASKGNLFILGKNISKLNRNELSSLHSEISLVCEETDLIDNLGVKSFSMKIHCLSIFNNFSSRFISFHFRPITSPYLIPVFRRV